MLKNRTGVVGLKNGLYALHNGQEFKLVEMSDGDYELISNDSNDISLGFSFYKEDVYTKKVLKYELDEVYIIDTFALYYEVKFKVDSEKDGHVLLGTSQSQMAENLGFERTDKYLYEKWVNIADVQLFEEKKLYTI
ncbi:hypothetical protein [Cohnella sp. GCM10027633]|uniref:hypothetical protein n=1 Tax=unclassified Cohnella TaxID=2636738 RepID=UPI0036352C64